MLGSQTADVDGLEALAVGCLYILLEKATVFFPTSTRAAPSHQVVTELGFGTLLRSGDRRYFPMVVRWNIWQEGIVPVLTDTSLQVTIKRMVSNRTSVEPCLDLLKTRLLESLQGAGYLPK